VAVVVRSPPDRRRMPYPIETGPSGMTRISTVLRRETRHTGGLMLASTGCIRSTLLAIPLCPIITGYLPTPAAAIAAWMEYKTDFVSPSFLFRILRLCRKRTTGMRHTSGQEPRISAVAGASFRSREKFGMVPSVYDYVSTALVSREYRLSVRKRPVSCPLLLWCARFTRVCSRPCGC
jgi:hypothetical protein